ncbi:hypothetical protein [Streptosporangium roseum]
MGRRVALVTGGSRGIGAATVAHPAGEGGRNITGPAVTVDAGTTA